jgi:hypothetical protein
MTEDEASTVKENDKLNRAPEHSRTATLSAAPKLESGYATFSKRQKDHEGNI